MTSMFKSATWRLTVAYVGVLAVLCLIFSAMLYNLATNELEHAFRMNLESEGPRIFLSTPEVFELRQQRLDNSHHSIIINLLIFNVGVIGVGAVASYFLARRSLAPIEAAHIAQGTFVSDAAHELRTPLTVMQTEIEVGLRDKAATKKAYSEILLSNMDELTRLRQLTDRLLILASQQEIVRSPIDIEPVVVWAINSVLLLAQQKNITIDSRVKSILAMADEESLTDVLKILLENAIKYSPRKSQIIVSSEIKDKMVQLKVIDQGIGISKKDAEHIFDRFYRADNSRSKQNVEGHGLGLSLAYRLTEQMKGDVILQKSSKKGSVFTVRLPRA